MSDKIYDVPAQWAGRAWVDGAKYRDMYTRSIKDPNGFWAEEAKRVGWIKPFTKVENSSFAPGNISIKWFEDGVLNVAWNCIDRHLDKRGDQTAIVSCMTRSASSPTSCAPAMSRRATASRFTCR
jgi:acetyl-CoA synthetase